MFWSSCAKKNCEPGTSEGDGEESCFLEDVLRACGTIYIEPASPWKNGFVESFHGRFSDECLNREQLWTLTEARVVIEDFRRDYNHDRPHSKLGYQSPVPFAASQSAPSSAPVALRAPCAEDGQTKTTNLNIKAKSSD